LLRRYLVENRIQLLHAFDPDADLFGVPLGRFFGIPVALTSQVWLRSIMPPLKRSLLALVDRIANGVFVNCEAVAKELTTQWNVSPKEIHVCYNGLETEEFNPYGRSRPPKLAGASVVIGTLAVLRKEKNLGLLIEAFARVRMIDPRAVLLIVGSGPMKPALERQAQSLYLGDSCLFEEATDRPADWMRAIDIFVLPSDSEGFSNALLEAMGCGCCAVGSRVGGTPELILHGERGFLFEAGNVLELADQLCKLTLDPALRELIAVKASDYVREHLNIELAAARLATIYRNLLRRKRSSCVDVPAQAREVLTDTRCGLERDRLC
jgi:glycosyltransferase involved in cell wall biosynthesis